MERYARFWFAALIATACTAAASGDALDDAIQTLKNVGPNAQGHAAAQQAWRTAAAASPSDLPRLLAGLDDAVPLAANWIRAAVESAADRAIASGDRSTAAPLETFLLETAHSPRARRLAYDLLVRVDPSAEKRLMPGFLNDPSTELRRDAVERLIATAEKTASPEEKKKLYRQAFAASRDVDQVKQLAGVLEKLEEKVDLPTHFGFVTHWKLIGPFDNVGEKGFHIAYPPETEIKLDGKYPGKEGKEVAWQDFATESPYGEVDLNKALGKNKGAAAYAFTEFTAAAAVPVEIRIGSISAIKLWVNGKLLDSREVYHSGVEIDQYVSRTQLQPGVNRILIKVCENEQTEQWAQDWSFQLRVCDATGTAVLSQNRLAKRE